MASSKKRKNDFTLQEKLAILEAVDQGGKKKMDIAKDFGIPPNTLSTIISQRERIEEAFQSNTCDLDKKRICTSRYANVDKALAAWCRQVQSEGVSLSARMIRTKAKECAAVLNHPKFVCDKKWLTSFRNRHGIVVKERSNTLQHIKHKKLKNVPLIEFEEENYNPSEIVQNYKPCDVYCAHGFTLYWSALPSCAFQNLHKTLQDQIQERFTVLVASSMDGSQKLPLRVIIDKTAQSLSGLIKVRSNSPVDYTYSNGAVLEPEIFIQWIQHLDKVFQMEKRSVCFLVDKSSVYPGVIGLQAIRLVHVARDEMSNCQPCQQGIAQYLKTTYRLRLAQKLTACIADKKESEILAFTLLDAFRILQESWRAVPDEIIQQAFEKAGFLVQITFDSNASTAVFRPAPNTSQSFTFSNSEDLIDNIKKSCPLSKTVKRACMTIAMQHFHTVDEALEKQFQQDVISPVEQVQNKSGKNTVSMSPTAEQASEAVQTLKHFFQSQNLPNASTANCVLASLGDLDETLKTISAPKL